MVIKCISSSVFRVFPEICKNVDVISAGYYDDLQPAQLG